MQGEGEERGKRVGRERDRGRKRRGKIGGKRGHISDEKDVTLFRKCDAILGKFFHSVAASCYT